MNDLLTLLKDDPALLALIKKKEGLSELTEVEETLLIANAFKQQEQSLVIIKGNAYSAQQLYYRLYPLLKDDVLLFVVEESLRVEAVAASPTAYANQMDVLSQLCLNNKKKVVITHEAAVTRYLPTVDTFNKSILKLKVAQTYRMNDLRDKLISDGYKQTSHVDQPLTFAMRGGVIDVYSINQAYPIRIEFFDDEIDSIRSFDISTQRTLERLNETTIVPASILIYDGNFEDTKKRILEQLEKDKGKSNNYFVLKNNIERDVSYLENHLFEHYLYRYACFYDNRASILEYINDPYVILSTTEQIDNNIEFNIAENSEYITELYNDDDGLNYYSVFDDFYRLIDKYQPYKITSISNYKSVIKSDVKLSYFPLLPLNKVVGEIVRLSDNYQLYVAVSKGQYDVLNNEFNSQQMSIDKYCTYLDCQLAEGFSYNDKIFLTEKELFGIKTTKGKYDSKFKEAIVLESYQDLINGDYVVHNQYGIGRYEGIITKEIDGKHRDYLQVRYRDDDMLLVPLEQFKLVRKFVSAESIGVKLSKLGSNAWSKTKEKISKEVNDIAERLIKLYAARESNIGFAFSKDDQYVKSFEENFPYELTKDQVQAIAEIKYDMEQPKPMDRLLCGDVGFGKTEVAMVAAFKAIKDLKQVAYLCPTTILSRQHYNSFVERFKGFPVRIALLNRYVIESEQKQIIKDLKEGKIDVLIGTHRIISNDVEFADLGLLIIDEEQRFGVQAKEKIKELKQSIDVLSLSATPIPRTLQMSLVGVMSLSQLNVAPNNRMPIQTYVVGKNDNLIKEVIQRELARNGQVFYLHNNVDDIYNLSRKLSIMLPNAKICVGHGKMNREEIEDVMYRFVDKQYDILICTTIIETGIDIPNANTILIDNAENFGLSQLYQIRGRVGRSDRIAYAYLMYNSQKQISETASKRLQAIKEFTELGSGYKIALRDLTIRGAGDLLGERQAGFINTIGMSLYLDMLNSAIRRQKGFSEEIIEENKIHINDVDGYVDNKFVNKDYEKLTIYQQLDKLRTKEQLDKYHAELTDYYGKLPTSIENLFEKQEIELMLNNERIERYDQGDKSNLLVLSKEFSDKVDGVKLFQMISDVSSNIKLKYTQGRINLLFEKKKGYQNYVNKALEVINNL